jgi:hypothetical protein
MQERITKLADKDQQVQLFYSGLLESNSVEQIMPCAVIKEAINDDSGNLDYQVIAYGKDDYKKINNLETHQISQCFIYGNQKNVSIIRFFYFPNKHNSEAFKIENNESFTKKRISKSLFMVRENEENSLTFVKIMYSNKSFFTQTNTLVAFIEKYRRVTVSKIVCDWILDANGRYFLIDVKELSYERR